MGGVDHKLQRVKAGVLPLGAGEDVGPGVSGGRVQGVGKGPHMDEHGVDPFLLGGLGDLQIIGLKCLLGVLRGGEGEIGHPHSHQRFLLCLGDNCGGAGRRGDSRLLPYRGRRFLAEKPHACHGGKQRQPKNQVTVFAQMEFSHRDFLSSAAFLTAGTLWGIIEIVYVYAAPGRAMFARGAL